MASYQGVVILDQGSIVSEPALGSTTPGDIVWNPGTLAAGSGSDVSARLVYFFDVTGAAPPYSVAAAAASGSGNGTRATWIDETGTDFTFGELCGMTISSPVPPTPVVLSDVRGTIEGGVPTLRFTTASEAETLGFRVERRVGDAWLPVHPGRLDALLDQPQGGRYRLADLGAGDVATYRLREFTSTGREQLYGPFDVEFHGSDDEPGVQAPAFAAAPHPPSADHLARLDARRAELAARASEAPAGAALQGGGAERIKVLVSETGIQRLEIADLVATYFVPEAEIEDRLASGGFDLTLGGERLAWTRSADGAALEFYGEALDTPYTGTNVYWLERAPGLVMRRTPSRPAPPDWGAETFTEALRLERNNRPVVILDLDPESDNWF
ncbi:MAG: hypothetical protein AAFY88_29225, partial [Acidobacteriota bacterium]